MNNKLHTLNDRERRTHLAIVESALRKGFQRFAYTNGFHMVNPPHIVPITGACENVDTLFDLNYYGEESFLNQTGQTALEMFVGELGKVACEIKSFRKETEADGRHLTEFPLPEFEVAYGENEDGFEVLLHNIELSVKTMLKEVLIEAQNSLKLLGSNPGKIMEWVHEPFNRILYDDAIKMVGKTWGEDLESEDEMRILAHFGNKPTFVTKYPLEIKFFNMKEDRNYIAPDGKSKRVLSTDLLMPFAGESVGAAVREEDPIALKARLIESEMFRILSARGKTLEDFREYLDEVEAKPTPHAGCGIGLYRLLQSVCQTHDIRLSSTYLMNAGMKPGYSASRPLKVAPITN